MKNNYACVARSLIAILFVYAGIGKIMSFTQTSGYIGSLGVPLPVLATIIVILIEIPVALMFAYGYKVKQNGYAMIAFTILATLLVHNKISDQMQLIMALKNVAIVGGILACISCACEDCVVHSKKHHSA